MLRIRDTLMVTACMLLLAVTGAVAQQPRREGMPSQMEGMKPDTMHEMQGMMYGMPGMMYGMPGMMYGMPGTYGRQGMMHGMPGTYGMQGMMYGMPGTYGMQGMMHGMPGMMHDVPQMQGMIQETMAVHAYAPDALLYRKTDLGLTADQVRKLEDLAAEVRTARDHAKTEHDQRRARIMAEFKLAKPDPSKVRNDGQESMQDNAAAHGIELSAFARAKGLLTDAQRAQVDGWVEHQKMMQWGMDHSTH